MNIESYSKTLTAKCKQVKVKLLIILEQHFEDHDLHASWNAPSMICWNCFDHREQTRVNKRLVVNVGHLLLGETFLKGMS